MVRAIGFGAGEGAIRGTGAIGLGAGAILSTGWVRILKSVGAEEIRSSGGTEEIRRSVGLVNELIILGSVTYSI